MATTLLVGLGNPGERYQNTRHNFGAYAVRALADKLGLTRHAQGTAGMVAETKNGQEKILLLLPDAYMNESGSAVAELMHYFSLGPESVWLIHDDLDLPLGTIRISVGASAAGHRGVVSVHEVLASEVCPRFRLGIGRPPVPVPTEAFVLQNFSDAEKIVAREVAEHRAPELLQLALAQGLAAAIKVPESTKKPAPAD